jgi:hypothetical protein
MPEQMPVGAPRRPLPAPGAFCEKCGTEGDVVNVTFRRNIGALVVRFSQELRGNMCAGCIKSSFWETTLITLFLGWWGLISFIVSPFFLITNAVNYAAARRLVGGAQVLVGFVVVFGLPLLAVALLVASGGRSRVHH